MSELNGTDKTPANAAAAGAADLQLDAEALYAMMLRAVRTLCSPATRLVGVTSGGAWLAERLQRDLALENAPGIISSALHRDDYKQRGLASGGQTTLPFDVNDADILVLDDVLYTGRTIRAVINELFDYGRPASIRLAVLVDRGGRELPIQPDYVAQRVDLPGNLVLRLAQDEQGRFTFEVGQA